MNNITSLTKAREELAKLEHRVMSVSIELSRQSRLNRDTMASMIKSYAELERKLLLLVTLTTVLNSFLAVGVLAFLIT